MWIELIGWTGSVLFALCGAPQAYASWKQKHSDGLTWPLLIMWTGGEILTIVYVSTKDGIMPLLLNYYLNLVFLSVIIWYRAFPRRTNVPT